METESAVSPLAKWVIRLDVSPLGHANKMMIPIAMSGCNEKISIKENPQ
jgi:hypothetical protein